MSADPPWFDEAVEVYRQAWSTSPFPRSVAGVRAVIAFAASQRRPEDLLQAAAYAEDGKVNIPVEEFADVIGCAREEGRRQPQQITDAMVEAAARQVFLFAHSDADWDACYKWYKRGLADTDYRTAAFDAIGEALGSARAALEAAEKARTE